ncbi:unnamed protein product [Prunus armeniaca]
MPKRASERGRRKSPEAFIYLAGCTFSTARRGDEWRGVATCGEADEGRLFCKRPREEEDDLACFFLGFVGNEMTSFHKI